MIIKIYFGLVNFATENNNVINIAMKTRVLILFYQI